ncbi:acrylyl-CoA reductase (NADPH) [Neisseria sp. Ec49-e6-T10]|uniref:acrylyl-CoA reductase (NADPH) n=1 Tax=Neisseria sp. Ec49-e6-T10 TaxID=3140744 RepID=UPI003EB76125
MNFNAIILNKSETLPFNASIAQVSQQELMQQDADTLIKIDYSTLNYKDALALTNSNPVVRKWPMIPGIDGVGTVVESKNNQFQIGQKVVLNGWGVGETHWGCLAQYAYLKSEWLIPLPAPISVWQAIALGTAGYTAALCVLKIMQHGVKPNDGSILVTGATGGVGSIAIALLAKNGYHITATTGKAQEKAYLERLGATTIIDRQAFSQAGKALQKEQWVAAVDVSGSHTLANICAQTYYGGIVTACGLAQGLDFPANVAPFILRGITLAGIDSVMAPKQARLQAWAFLAEHLDLTLLDDIAQTITLSQSFDKAKNIMAGQVKGRFVVDVNQ